MSQSPSVAVIGAGLGGLAMAIKAKEAGVTDLAVFEKADRVGGTWRENTYPGCACDVPVALYQFSFAPNPGWSHLFPRAAEIQAYAESLADTFQLRPHLHMNAEVEKAEWDDAAQVWRLRTKDGRTQTAQVLVAALGQLSRPQLPEIEGRDSFAGTAFHSAQWRHDIDLTGKRVGVIGSAASAVQFIPEIAKVAGHLTVFQRTPNWLVPRLDREITDEEKALMMTEPETALSMLQANRDLIYKNADTFFWQAFQWTPQGRAAYTRQALDHLHAQVADPELRKKLTPDYPVGCKRILICDDFYPALQRPNVRLVTERIARIAPEGVVTKDGETHGFDVLIYATGFETTGWRWSADVIGKGGKSLADEWHGGPEAYLGLTVKNFPNMFMLYGPNTNLGHNSITFMHECQIGYIVQAIQAMRDGRVGAMDVTPAAQARFNEDLQKRLGGTVWADPHCASWYKTADGRITQNWSSHTRDYAKATSKIAWDDYAVSSRTLASA